MVRFHNQGWRKLIASLFENLQSTIFEHGKQSWRLILKVIIKLLTILWKYSNSLFTLNRALLFSRTPMRQLPSISNDHYLEPASAGEKGRHLNILLPSPHFKRLSGLQNCLTARKVPFKVATLGQLLVFRPWYLFFKCYFTLWFGMVIFLKIVPVIQWFSVLKFVVIA